MKRKVSCISIFYMKDGTYDVHVERDDHRDEREYKDVYPATLDRLETLAYRNSTAVNITQGTPAIFVRPN